jgi:formate hydrogenlyase subunit 4
MSVLYPLIQALVLFAVAPLLSGITRVARARLHNRRGPGVLQEYRDIIKLLGRQSVGPDASGWVFRLTPYVMVGVMLTIATALPVVTVGSPLPQLGDLITLLYLFAIARFFFAISGLDTGSPFTAIGASREAMLGVLVEPMLLLGLWVAAQVAGSTNISNITDTASSYSCDSLIAAVGQTSSQRPQKMQRPRLNCHASSPVARSVSTVKAFDGQALTQAAQPMHCCGFCSGLPRKFLSTAIGSSG